MDELKRWSNSLGRIGPVLASRDADVSVLKPGPKLPRCSRPKCGGCRLRMDRSRPMRSSAQRQIGQRRRSSDTGANVTAEAAIPAINEYKPTLRKRPLTRLESCGRPQWTCSTLMLSFCRPPRLYIGSGKRLCVPTADTSRRSSNHDLMGGSLAGSVKCRDIFPATRPSESATNGRGIGRIAGHGPCQCALSDRIHRLERSGARLRRRPRRPGPTGYRRQR